MDETTKLNLTQTQFSFFKFIFKALPVATTLGGALFGYLEGHDMGHNIIATLKGCEMTRVADVIPWYTILENMVAGTMLGISGGVALSGFGLAALDVTTVVVKPTNRYTKARGGGAKCPSSSIIYYQRLDVDDHMSSIIKVAEKLDTQRQKEKCKAQEMLKAGTDGTRKGKT
ncbi:MAG: hypothetical protein FWG73_02645 [Planctomycetaceae bacterium]|nr:hypothetical protein [Planctomycetaceae bacterium]